MSDLEEEVADNGTSVPSLVSPMTGRRKMDEEIRRTQSSSTRSSILRSLIKRDEVGLYQFASHFQILRRAEYDEYLLEAQARHRVAGGKPGGCIDLLSFKEFMSSSYFLKDNRYLHRFNFASFSKYLFAHLLYYFTGPFSWIVLFPMFGKTEMYNMRFYGFSTTFIIQTFIWIGVMGPTLLYIFEPECGIFRTEIQAVILSLFFRALIIGVRYAYLSDSLLFVQKHIVIPYNKFSKDFAIFGWQSIKDDDIQKEIEITLIRQKVDPDYMQLSLLEEAEDVLFKEYIKRPYERRQEVVQEAIPKMESELLERETSERSPERKKSKRRTNVTVELTKKSTLWADELELNNSSTNDIVPEEQSVDNSSINAINFMRELIVITRDRNQHFLPFHVYLIFIVLVPTAFRTYHGIAPFGETWHIPFFILLLAASYTLNFVNIAFINLAYIDSSRRLFFVEVLSSMISIHKDYKFSLQKICPLVDVFDPKALSAWFQLRLLLLDVGKRYADKIEVYFSAIVLAYIILAVWFFLVLFGFIKLDSLDVHLQAILVGNLLFLIFIWIALVLFNGANINEHFKIHKDLLLRNKTHYLNAGLHIGEAHSTKKYVNKMMLFAAQKAEALKDRKEFATTVEDLAFTTDTIVGKLESEEKRSPYKILGIKVDWLLIGKIAAFLGSLAALLAQFYGRILKLSDSNLE